MFIQYMVLLSAADNQEQHTERTLRSRLLAALVVYLCCCLMLQVETSLKLLQLSSCRVESHGRIPLVREAGWLLV